jgi:hypothetical protein
MSNRILALGVSGFLAVAAIAPGTRAATIDTYDITQDGYTVDGFSGVLTGSFTGAVEADGLIKLADLSSANVQVTLSAPLLPGGFSLSDISSLFIQYQWRLWHVRFDRRRWLFMCRRGRGGWI